MMNQETKNNIFSNEFDDDNVDYKSLESLLDDDSNRKKNKIYNYIIENGDMLSHEIDINNKKRKLKCKQYIPYILKKSNEFTEEELESYSLSDVYDIYSQLKIQNRSIFIKIFYYLFFEK